MRELGTRLMTAFSRARGMSGRALVCRICAFLLGVMMFAVSAQGQKININYPNRSGSNWPLFIAKEGGYYQKYGLDVNLVFGIHPAGIAMLVSGEGQMVNSSLEQLMQAASRDGSMVLMCSSLNKGMFALMANKNIATIGDLKGKRIAIGQLGDAPFGYLSALLGKNGIKPRDVQWIPVGTDVSGRVAALQSGRADATLLTAPAYFKVEEAGYRMLANLADHDDIFAATACLFRKRTLQADPLLPEKILKAQSEAVKRFYEDKAFAVAAFLAYDKTAQPAEVARVYDLYARSQSFERVPYVLATAVKSVLDQQSDPNVATQMKAYDWKQVIDNRIVGKLAQEGFFEQLFGAGIRDELERKSKLAFR